MKPLLFVLLLASCAAPPPKPATTVTEIKPALATEPVTDDPDDPAIWRNETDPDNSLIVATNKVKRPNGALYVFGLDGKIRQTVKDLDRPNNVDVEYGLMLNGKPVDIAVTTERLQKQLRVFRVNAEGLTPLATLPVFEDRKGDQAAPMGISLYKRPKDGAIFAIVAPKEGPSHGYLAQYRLEDDGKGGVKSTFVRYFGRFSLTKEIEAVAVDDALGFVYYADEGDGIHKYHADPDHPEAAKEVAHFGRAGFKADREGIAIYARPGGTGFLVCTDQLENNTEYYVYPREGTQTEPIRILRGPADSTDGLEISSAPLGKAFPNGLMIAMNSKGKNFLLFDWRGLIQ